MAAHTENRYHRSIGYPAKDGKKVKQGQLLICGIDDLILVHTDCNGQHYEKLINVKQVKSRTADESMAKAMETIDEKMYAWMTQIAECEGRPLNGQDFYGHGIKAGMTKCGMSLTAYWELVAEGSITNDPGAPVLGAWQRKNREAVMQKGA